MKNSRGDLVKRLTKLANNLWWSWNDDAVALFTSVDPPLFAATNQNPIRMLKLLAPHQITAIESDPDFIARLESVEEQLSRYLSARTWYESIAPKTGRKLKIAYFCANSPCMNRSRNIPAAWACSRVIISNPRPISGFPLLESVCFTATDITSRNSRPTALRESSTRSWISPNYRSPTPESSSTFPWPTASSPRKSGGKPSAG